MKQKTAFFLLFISIGLLAESDPVKVLQELIARNDTIQTESFTVHSMERYEGEMKEKLADVKIQRNPRKMYYKRHYPRKNLELIWNMEQYETVKIKTNGFPNLNLNLEPYRGIIRKNTRHILDDAGWDFIINTLESILTNRSKSISISLLADTILFGIPSYHIQMNFNNFNYSAYITQMGDSTKTLIKKHHLNEYMLLEKNPEIRDFGLLLPGLSLKIPNVYAKKFVLFLSKKNLDILKIEAWDEEGLFESFEFTNIQLNLTFDHELFIMD